MAGEISRETNGFDSFLPFCWDDYDGTTRD